MNAVCIVQLIKLCAWLTLMDMLVGILMDSMAFYSILFYGGYGVGQRNLDGRMLLEFCLSLC